MSSEPWLVQVFSFHSLFMQNKILATMTSNNRPINVYDFNINKTLSQKELSSLVGTWVNFSLIDLIGFHSAIVFLSQNYKLFLSIPEATTATIEQNRALNFPTFIDRMPNPCPRKNSRIDNWSMSLATHFLNMITDRDF